MAKGHGLRLYRQQLYGSGAGVGVGVGGGGIRPKLYTPLRVVKNSKRLSAVDHSIACS